MATRDASEPGGLGLFAGTRPHRFLHQLDESGAVNQFDRVVGGELVRRQREGPRGDEEALVAAGVVDRAEELLELGRADDPSPEVLALDDPEEAIAADPQIDPLVPGTADLARPRSPAPRRSRRRTPRTPSGSARPSCESFRSARRACCRILSACSFPSRTRSRIDRHSSSALARSAASSRSISIDLEQRVLDRVVEPEPLGLGQRILIAAEDGILQVLDGPGQLRVRADRGGIVTISNARPEQALTTRGQRGRGRRHFGRITLGLQPIEQHRRAPGSKTLHRPQSPQPCKHATYQTGGTTGRDGRNPHFRYARSRGCPQEKSRPSTNSVAILFGGQARASRNRDSSPPVAEEATRTRGFGRLMTIAQASRSVGALCLAFGREDRIYW